MFLSDLIEKERKKTIWRLRVQRNVYWKWWETHCRVHLIWVSSLRVFVCVCERGRTKNEKENDNTNEKARKRQKTFQLKAHVRNTRYTIPHYVPTFSWWNFAIPVVLVQLNVFYDSPVDIDMRYICLNRIALILITAPEQSSTEAWQKSDTFCQSISERWKKRRYFSSMRYFVVLACCTCSYEALARFVG